MFDNTKMYIHF